MSVADYVALWQTIDALLRQHTPRAARQLRGPITDAGMAWIRATARKGGCRKVDPAVEATYAAHDGAKGTRPSILALLPCSKETAWATSCEWHSSWTAKEELATWQDVLGADDAGDDDPGWPSTWLPFGRDGGGNAVVVSLSSGELFTYDHEDGEPTDITTLGSVLVSLEADLRAGMIQEDEDGSLVRGTKSTAAAAAAKPDEAAVLLQMLVEKRLAALEPTPALTDAVRKVLASRGRARTKKLVKLLYDHDDVSDVFADDEVLGVFMEEFG